MRLLQNNQHETQTLTLLVAQMVQYDEVCTGMMRLSFHACIYIYIYIYIYQ